MIPLTPFLFAVAAVIAAGAMTVAYCIGYHKGHIAACKQEQARAFRRVLEG